MLATSVGSAPDECRSASRLVLGVLLFVGAAGYVFLPQEPAKFFCLCLCLGLGAAASWLGPTPRWLLWSGGVVLTYAFAFLLTPVSLAPFLRPAGLSAGAATLGWQVGLLVVGLGWVYLALRWTGPAGSARVALEGKFVALWAALLVAVHIQAWSVDVTYGGDEHYHMASADVDGVLCHILVSRSGLTWLAIGWGLVGLMLGWRSRTARAGKSGGGPKTNRRCLHRQQEPRRPGWGVLWLLAGLLIAGAAPLLTYPSATAQIGLLTERSVRYPAASPWFSALLALPCYESWGGRQPFSFMLLRFVPLLALFIQGLQCGGDQRWRGHSSAVKALAVLGVLSVPTLLYHGTLLYLELPMLPLFWLILRDSRRWFLASPRALARRPAWWGAVLLQFTKDTAIVAIAFLWLARLVWRVWRGWRRRSWSGLAWAGEASLAGVILGPGVLYMALRTLQGTRPYLFQAENLVQIGIWWKALGGLATQFGALWCLAGLGAVCLWRGRQRAAVVLAGLLLVSISAFHFLERHEWVGLARYNLLVLPAVLFLGWEGLTWLAQRLGAWTGLVCLGLLAANLLGSPLDRHGQRADWGYSGERWYAYSACLADIRREMPEATVALGNMKFPYGIGLITARLGWESVRILQLPPAEGASDLASLAATLEQASARGADYLVYLYEKLPSLGDHARLGHYRKARDYPSRVGGLLLFRRAPGDPGI